MFRKYLLVFSLMLSPYAIASTEFDMTYTDPFNGGAVSAVLTGDLTASPGVYQITGISGTFDGTAITGIDTGYWGPDNLLYMNGRGFFDGNGLSFDTTTTPVNIYNGVLEIDNLVINVAISDLAVQQVHVPEPATLALFAVGALAFRQKRRS